MTSLSGGRTASGGAADLFEFLSLVSGPRPQNAVPIIDRAAGGPWSDTVGSMIRLAALSPVDDLLWFYRLRNLWANAGCPPLKPAVTQRRVLLLADFTANQLPPLLSIMCAARGVEVAVDLAEFDSVEQEVLNPAARTYSVPYDLIVLSLSTHWLRRYLGPTALVAQRSLEDAKDVIRTLLSALTEGTGATVIVTNFAGQPLPFPAGQVRTAEQVGWNLAIAEVNHWLAGAVTGRVHLADVAGATFEAGGRAVLGLSSYLRGRMVFEPSGAVAVGRELASAIAHVCGKTHRALVTDWDNTLWGGEVADVGSHGIVCGLDAPDALGYRMVQEFIKGLKPLGILLAAASRNDPGIESVFDENSELVIHVNDFASVQVGRGPKSSSIAAIASDLGFGSEFMVFLDDSLFEIAEVISAHPFIDVLCAGPDPEATLHALTGARLFNTVSLAAEDLGRSAAADALKAQRTLRSTVADLDDFLRQIRISLTVVDVGDENIARVAQLFQKTNQFNLTTRRYSEADLRRLQGNGARLAAFSYRDTFGPQGIIAALVLCTEADVLHLDSWVMSCRVLNRTVEDAMFAWVRGGAEGRPVRGEYRPTDKNALVRGLYERLGFRLESRDAESGSEVWQFDTVRAPEPRHFVTFTEAD